VRRPLSSLNALRFFDAAARHQSFTRAAEELCVTQGAVSHQVKALEAELGVRLFNREHHGLVITSAGRDYCRPLGTDRTSKSASVQGEFKAALSRSDEHTPLLSRDGAGRPLLRLARAERRRR
jgi:hypothetical protein